MIERIIILSLLTAFLLLAAILFLFFVALNLHLVVFA